MELGEKIKYHRERLGMTLEELGNKIGVGKSTVRKWENGIIANMRRDKIDKIASALEVSPAYLMGWTDDPSLNHSLVENISIAYQRDLYEGKIDPPDLGDYELTEQEDALIDDFRKLSPTEKESICNIVSKMANGANGLDRVIEQKQEEPEVYTLDNAEVYVIKSDGTKARFINLGKTVKSPMEKYHPVPAERLVRVKASAAPRPRKLASIGNKVAKKKKG